MYAPVCLMERKRILAVNTGTHTSKPNIHPSIIRLEHVGKDFTTESGKRIAVLDDINLDIKTGQLVTVVGATGTGKTTLLNLIASICKADQGRITLNKTLNICNEIAYVFQHYTLLPWQNVLKNVAFGLQLRKIPIRQRNDDAMKLIDKVGLAGFEKAYPHELSGGMRQRAAIAQALAIKPKLLLMDEPFGSLDDTTRTELQRMLIDLHRQTQTTTIFVTHNIDEAIILADRIVVLAQRPAVIQQDITIDLPRPRNRTSRQFTDIYLKIRNMITTKEVIE